jgi:hypothetical protein
VHSNPDTERMMMGGGGVAQVRLTIDTAGAPMDELLAELLKRYVRDAGGGDVQAALGYSRR